MWPRSLAWLKFCSRSQAVSLPVTLGGESRAWKNIGPLQTCLILLMIQKSKTTTIWMYKTPVDNWSFTTNLNWWNPDLTINIRAQPCRAFRQAQLSAKVLGPWVDWLLLVSACFYTCQANVCLCLSQFSPPISIHLYILPYSTEACVHLAYQHTPVAKMLRAAGELPGHDPKLQKMPPGRKMKSPALFFGFNCSDRLFETCLLYVN